MIPINSSILIQVNHLNIKAIIVMEIVEEITIREDMTIRIVIMDLIEIEMIERERNILTMMIHHKMPAKLTLKDRLFLMTIFFDK